MLNVLATTTSSRTVVPTDCHCQQMYRRERSGYVFYLVEKKITLPNFRICRNHWPKKTPMVKVHGKSRPLLSPSVFNIPKSLLPTPIPPPRRPKKQFALQAHFDQRDQFNSYESFVPEKKMQKEYNNIIHSRTSKKLTFIFMNDDESETLCTIIVYNQQTLCSPVKFRAFKDGIEVLVPKNIINPNNGFGRYSQFFEAVNYAIQYQVPANLQLEKVGKKLEQILESNILEQSKSKKLQFFSRQIQLLVKKQYSLSDYCFAISSFPKARYDQLRQMLVLPSERKIRSIISSVNEKDIVKELFQKLKHQQQRYCLLLIDEVKIRPIVAFSGGTLHGFAKNNEESKASSMLGVMVKCLYGGPSLMVSVTPVHRLTASYQFMKVKEVASIVEDSGRKVIGSITDNHKINQHYCKLFDSINEFKAK